ncbi:MAG TPA: HDOD domain-containing protein [Vicinamibacterales bacterium]|jgi:putative nucleotidyltransferase with HDIG domain|nr:HDOD domain-containing protein [Vicinamibacterales bacterium]
MTTGHATSWAEWVDSGQWNSSSDTAMPMLPALAGDVMTLALDPDVSVLRIARVISKEQVLATRVLRLANSAYCAPMQEITTINDAIVRMGTAAVRNVVLAVCFASRLQAANVYGPQGRDLVDHGIGSAYLARLVAERAGLDPDEAFMFGLLHDIGKLVLLKQVRDFIKSGGQAPTPEEIDAFVRDRHAEVGARILRQWQLPETLIEPVRYHHTPDAAPTHKDEAAVVYMANRLSHRYGFGCTAGEADDITEDPIFTELRLNAQWLKDTDQRAPGLFEVARQIVA